MTQRSHRVLERLRAVDGRALACIRRRDERWHDILERGNTGMLSASADDCDPSDVMHWALLCALAEMPEAGPPHDEMPGPGQEPSR